MRIRLEPIKKVARSIRKHQELDPELVRRQMAILGRHRRGTEHRVKLAIRKAYGFKTLDTAEMACITPWDAYPSPNSLTNSGEEAFFVVAGRSAPVKSAAHLAVMAAGFGLRRWWRRGSRGG